MFAIINARRYCQCAGCGKACTGETLEQWLPEAKGLKYYCIDCMATCDVQPRHLSQAREILHQIQPLLPGKTIVITLPYESLSFYGVEVSYTNPEGIKHTFKTLITEDEIKGSGIELFVRQSGEQAIASFMVNDQSAIKLSLSTQEAVSVHHVLSLIPVLNSSELPFSAMQEVLRGLMNDPRWQDALRKIEEQLSERVKQQASK